jgi:mycothiol synthase
MGFEMHSNKVSLVPKMYRDPMDFERMKDVLISGRQVNNNAHYIHPGDLSWWLYYPPFNENPWQYIYLWGDPGPGDKLVGWALFSPRWRTFDVFVSPEFYASDLEAQLITWSIEKIAYIVRENGGTNIRTMWINENDAWFISLLEQHGFEKDARYMLYMERSLDAPISEITLPPELHLRHVLGEQDLIPRAAVSYAAFGWSAPFEQYVQRYRNFMRSPVYAPERDIIALAPNGHFAAFCLYWLDTTNRIGLFEPVGVHPDFQRRGLGKCVLLEGMQKMRASGMKIAAVCAEHDNPAAQKLYHSLGFRTIRTLNTYQKDI